jgi:hypothetical protein
MITAPTPFAMTVANGMVASAKGIVRHTRPVFAIGASRKRPLPNRATLDTLQHRKDIVMTDNQIAAIAEGLSEIEREWITGWQGPKGAAFNCVAIDLGCKGLLRSATDWSLNEKGEAVRNHLQEQANARI